MGRNTIGGKGHKRAKKTTVDRHRQIDYADEESTFYGLIVSAQGDSRFLVHCSDKIERIGLVRGTMYKKCYIEEGDLVLVSLRSFETVKDGERERCDLVVKYNQQDIEQLRDNGLYYKNTKKPFSTSLEHGRPADTKELDDEIQFGSVEPDKTTQEILDSDSEEEILPIKQPIVKKSNVKIIDTNEKLGEFNFDDI